MSSRTLPAASSREVSMADKIAGIDVHKKILMVVVMDARTPESKPERRRFATLPGELRRLSTWLQEQGVEEAVMESTAQYWRSVWLEAAHAAARSKGTHFQAVFRRLLPRLGSVRCLGHRTSPMPLGLEDSSSGNPLHRARHRFRAKAPHPSCRVAGNPA
jgi:hypothetical protein